MSDGKELHHIFASNIEQGKNTKYQDGILFPARHGNFVTKRADEDQHLQSMHDEQKCRHDVEHNGGIPRKWGEDIKQQD